MAYYEKVGKDKIKLIVNIGRDAKGKRKRKTKTIKYKTKKEVELELAKFVTEIQTGNYITPEKMQFTKFVDEWKEKYGKKQLSPKTYETYLGYINKRIIPTFGHLRIDQVNTFHILNFLDELQNDGVRGDNKEGGLSSGTIQYYHRILRNIFKRAEEWKVIKESPVKNVKKPKVVQRPSQVYDELQVNELMSALQKVNIKWKLIVSIAVTTGMRRGEIVGLTWDDIDLEKGKFYVKNSLTYTKEDGHLLKETKTKNSVRTITLAPSVTSLLKKYKNIKNKEKLSLGEKWEGGELFLVFSQWNGKPMHPSSVTTWWSRFLERNELPKITFHELRHTSATLMINRGNHMKLISARLGHSNIGTTMDLYGHALESADEKIANEFETLLQKKNNI
ncbi:hypothetical protein BTR23_16340 [Alkalihalophilus pseudofirmus]|nr:hypothetical protein BTR23_16340 [Alkalihalophilus pseudofirmus]